MSRPTIKNHKKLREEFCENLPIPVETPGKPVTFKKLEVISSLSDTKAVVIRRLPNAAVVRQQFRLDPFSKSLLLWERDGFVLRKHFVIKRLCFKKKCKECSEMCFRMFLF